MNDNTIPEFAGFVEETELVEIEGDDEVGGLAWTIPVTIALSMRFCPTSACTRSC